MERKDFLQGLSIMGLGAVLPVGVRATPKLKDDDYFFSCTLTATETAGPYPYPGTIPTTYTSSPLFRSNLIGDLPTAGGGGTLTANGIYPGLTTGGGIGLKLVLTIQNTNCTPVPNARVDIWHCDKRGIYSAYNSSQNGGDWTAYTFLRGIQTTDSNGQVTFTTIFPSWYIPRAIHLHIQVYYNGSLSLTTQLAIPDSLGQTVNNTSSSGSYSRNYTYTNATDQVFSDGTSTELASFTGANTTGYNGTATVIAPITILPLQLLSFRAGIEAGQVALKWTTTNEDNVSHFEVEQSIDGRSFTKVGSLIALNRLGTNSYSLKDNLKSGIIYYRLKTVDIDGNYIYSDVVVVSGSTFHNVSVYPNPAKDKILIEHPKTDSATWVRVMNIAGMTVARQQLPAGISVTQFDVSSFAPGTYLLTIESKSDKESVRFTKQ